MDDGRITDGQGRVIDARNCIVVMTSNIGAEYLGRSATIDGKIDANTKALVTKALEDYFLPEFLNRISETIIFNRLSKGEIRKIVEVRLLEIQKRLELNGRNVTIDCSPAVRDYLGTAGYNPQYGARPLARLIETEVLNKLAVLILRGSVRDGETARVVLDQGRVRVLSNHENAESSSDDEDMELDAEDLEDAIKHTNDDDDMDLALYE